LDGEASAGYQGACEGSEEKLHEGFARYSDPSRVTVCRGWFRDTFPRVTGVISDVAVLHVDGDWYDSVRQTLETFYGKVSSGGFVVIDDYGTWLRRIDHTGRFWQKTA
jgi:hypothetical protein